MKRSTMTLGVSLLTLLTFLSSEAGAQEGSKKEKKKKEKEGIDLILPKMQQLTIQGLYGENKLVRTAGSPALGLTYSNYDLTHLNVGEDLDFTNKDESPPERLHLPNGGWFVDLLSGDRAGARVNSFGLGMSVRMTSTSLKGKGTSRDRFFYGMGLGLYATRVEAARSSTGIGLGSRFFVGKDFSDGTLIEAGYSYRPGTQGVHPSGLTIGLGRRF
ncbi:hypothetical protein [Armatimonas sp.]|uniref:hypothetical protein n=1 Tax=Armatimonas sp. TaxID=1872638 RepID=UPI00286C44A1|nr:hypothetical protein [Armatimonas sp.]